MSAATSHPSAPSPLNSGFFSFHGPWAPGVRLFRKLNFAAKAGLISATFGVPLVVLASFFYSNLAGQVAFSGKERLGVEYTGALAPLLDAGQRWRSGHDTAELVAAVDRSLAQMKAIDQRLGSELGTGKLFAALDQAVQALKGAAPAQAAVAADGVVKASNALLVQATDGSNLTLDPDIDSYYLMDGSLFRLPDLIDQVSELRDLAASVAGSGAPTPAQTERVGALLAIIDYMDSNLAGGLDKTLGLRPEMKSVLAADAVRQQLRVLRDMAAATTKAGAERPAAEPLRVAGDQAVAGLVALQQRMLQQLDGLLAARVAAMEQQGVVVSVVVAVFLLLATYLFYCFYRVMAGGLNEVQRHLRAMTGGDLTTQPRPWGRDEAAHLMHELSSMQMALRDIVGQVRSSADSMVSASAQIAGGAQDLSQRTNQASSSAQQSASAMEQVTATVQQTADHAQRASQIASQNADVAERGGQVMQRMVTTMDGIQQSSTRIGDIIGTIDGIAFQTNILALNAAVEAARAGEQGRGFAVVASEVRALAGRSAKAAGEIKALIQSSTEQVAAGNGIVREAGEAITATVESARVVQQLLSEIDTGTREQSLGMQQLGGAVQELDRSAQQNSALVEETAAAAASLRDTARSLADRVARFQLPAVTAWRG
jgi:methyl-accepting chemotaxis protein